MQLNTSLTDHAAGYTYAFFWWGLFAIYCIYRQVCRLRIFWYQRSLIQKTSIKPIPDNPSWQRYFNYMVKIPWVTEMMSVGCILRAFFFILVNVIFLLFAPFSLEPGASYAIPSFESASSRGAFMSIANYCFVLVLGTRNSIVYHMSGLSYEQTLPYHRLYARIAGVEAIAHIVYRMIKQYHRRYVVADALFYNPTQTTGTVWTIVFLVLYLTSIQWVRRRFFEVFYYSHIVCIVLGMIAACMHAPMVFVYLMPAIGLWLVDRAWRFYQSWFVKTKTIRIDEYNTDWSNQEGITRILFQDNGLSSYRPGQYVFIALAHRNRFTICKRYLDWHPLTISEIFRPRVNDMDQFCHNNASGAIEERIFSGSEKKKLHRTESTSSVSSGSKMSVDIFHMPDLRRRAPIIPTAEENEERTMLATVHVRALGKYTRELLESAMSKDDIRLKVDGPYGPLLDYYHHQTVACFAAGIGITPALSLIKDCVERRTMGVRTVATEAIYLFWVIPTQNDLLHCIDLIRYWFELAHKSALPIRLDLEIYVTRSSKGDDDLLDGLTDKEHLCRFVYGSRPNIGDCMDRIAKNRQGSVWTHVCGPSIFSRSVVNHASAKNWEAHYETFEF